MFPRSAAPSNDSPSPRLGRFSPSSLSSLQSRAARTIDAMSLLRAAAEQIPQGVMILSETGQVLDTNAAVPSIFGYGSDELIGLDFESLVPGYSAKPLEQFRITLKACRIGTDRPLYGRRKDGTSVLIEMGLSKILKADSRLVIACIVDLTERRNLETRLTAAIDENVGIQRLMSELVCRLAAADPKGVDDMILASLRRICRIAESRCGNRVASVAERDNPPPDPLLDAISVCGSRSILCRRAPMGDVEVEGEPGGLVRRPG